MKKLFGKESLTDINFPNALRPNKNPGYKTENK